jgi:hypothetical protein
LGAKNSGLLHLVEKKNLQLSTLVEKTGILGSGGGCVDDVIKHRKTSRGRGIRKIGHIKSRGK